MARRWSGSPCTRGARRTASRAAGASAARLSLPRSRLAPPACASQPAPVHAGGASLLLPLALRLILSHLQRSLPLLQRSARLARQRSALFSAISSAAFLSSSAQRAWRASLLRSSTVFGFKSTPRPSSSSAQIYSRFSTSSASSERSPSAP
jgi:hypothetical protein